MKPNPFLIQIFCVTLSVLLFTSLFFIGCGAAEEDNSQPQEDNNRPSIETITDKKLNVGDRTTVEVTVTDADVDDTHIISAYSDDTSVATVSVGNAILTIEAIAVGTATVEVSVTDDSGQYNAEAVPVTFQVTVNCQIPPLDEDFSGKPALFMEPASFRVRDTCVLLSDGNFVSFACTTGARQLVFGGPVQTSTDALVKFAGGDFLDKFLDWIQDDAVIEFAGGGFLNNFWDWIPDGELTESEVSDAIEGVIKLKENRSSISVHVPKQAGFTIKDSYLLIDVQATGLDNLTCIPNSNNAVVAELTKLAEDMLDIMRKNQ